MANDWALKDESTKLGGRNGISLQRNGKEVAFYFKADLVIEGKAFLMPADAPHWIAEQLAGIAEGERFAQKQDHRKEQKTLSDADRDFLLKCVACENNSAVDLRIAAVGILLADIAQMRDVTSPADKAEIGEDKPSNALRDSGAPRGTFTANARCPRCMKTMQKAIPCEPGDFPFNCCGHDFAIATLAVSIRGVNSPA